MPELLPYEPGSPEWLAARRAGVTATDIVTILGLSAWDSVYSLFWRKLGQVPEVPDNDRFRLGRVLESYARERWALSCEDAVYGSKEGLFRSSARPWQMATPDGVLYADEAPGPVAVLELKSWADADRHSWGQGCVYDEHGLLIHDGQVPAAVRAQVLWQMDVMGVSAGHVGVVFLPSGGFRSYIIGHGCGPNRSIADNESCDVCADLTLMRAAGEEFMGRLRLELPSPDPDSSAATLAAVRARFTRQPDKTAEVDPVIFRAWEAWKARKDNAETEVRAYEVQLREQAGEASVLTVDGLPVVRRVISDAHVKAHTRHQDYLKRITQGDDDEHVE